MGFWLAKTSFLLLYASVWSQAIAQFPAEDWLESVSYTPIVVPLAVRGPYLGTYLGGSKNKNLALQSPQFWTGAPVGWSGLLRVDGQTFNWMGNNTLFQSAFNKSLETTSYSSTFEFTNGPLSNATVSITAKFVSPITSRDLFRQSLPFSYLELSVKSLDGQPHQVQVYSSINGLWLMNMEEEEINWQNTAGNNWIGSSMSLVNQYTFAEENDRILSGDMWYIALDSPTSPIRTTFSTGVTLLETQALFASEGKLDDRVNSTSRAVRTRNLEGEVVDEPVIALAHDFGTISSETRASASRVLLSLGLVRDPIVQYMGPDETVDIMSPLWRSRFTDAKEMIDFVINDYTHVEWVSDTWNKKLYLDGVETGGKDYADIMAVSARQIFMAIEGVWDQTNRSREANDSRSHPPDMWMLKEISSNGNCQTVDVIAPMLPFLIYFNPDLLVSLLEPIYRYVRTGQYVPAPPPHDVGEHYPNATGRNDWIYPGLPLEEAGNFLCMARAGMLSTRIGKDQVAEYYPLIKQYSEYLVNATEFPGHQRTTDDFFAEASNQTSLVVKGIAGLASASEISRDMGDLTASERYKDIAVKYRDTLLNLGLSRDRSHLLGTYSNSSSWVTHYNLFYDKFLSLDIFPEWIYTMQNAWYPLFNEPFGPPLDSRNPTRSKTDWLIWTAAISKGRTKDMFIQAVSNYFKHSENTVFGDLITPQAGWSVGFLTRPVVGGHFALIGMIRMQQLHADALSWYHQYLPDLDFDGMKDEVFEKTYHLQQHATQNPVSSMLLGFTIVSVMILLIFKGHVANMFRKGIKGWWNMPSTANYELIHTKER